MWNTSLASISTTGKELYEHASMLTPYRWASNDPWKGPEDFVINRAFQKKRHRITNESLASRSRRQEGLAGLIAGKAPPRRRY